MALGFQPILSLVGEGASSRHAERRGVASLLGLSLSPKNNAPRDIASFEVFRRDLRVRSPRPSSSVLSPITLPGAGGQRSFLLVDDPEKVSSRRPERGSIKEFSDSSRRRLVHSIRNMPDMPVFCTLTYPSDFPTDGKLVKKHLHTFLQFLRRRKISGIWFLEFQKRGAPHFHMLLSEAVDFPTISRRWFEIVGSGDSKHLHAGTRIEYMREVAAGVRYAEKYAVKPEQKQVPEGYENVGRFWSVFGIKIDRSERVGVVAKEQIVSVARVVRRYALAVARKVNKPLKLNNRTTYTVYNGSKIVNMWLKWKNLPEIIPINQPIIPLGCTG